jgi:small subunit ribosomal protein S1
MKIKKTKSQMDDLLLRGEAKAIPRVGELIEGTVISAAKNEVLLDIEGLTIGIVRGKEIYDESGEYSEVKPNDKVSATVLELENESGQMELSFRYAGHQKAWNKLEELCGSQEVTEAKIMDANKGGLMIKVGNVIGFLPVSQLTTEHYPRVEGGDKNKILGILKKYIGHDFRVKVIDINEHEEKLIVSEKAAWEEKQNKSLAKYKIGDVVSGRVTGVVDFGAFIEFDDGLEGLIHISELAWQRIDDPKEVVKVGDTVKAEIISVDDSRVSLSIKKLLTDPWKNIDKKYKAGQKVQGKVLKLNPFGAFVELDQDIHGLIHISELNESSKKKEIKEGETYDFYIISIEPKEHRLGLSFEKKSENKKEAKDEPAQPAESTEETEKETKAEKE